MLVIGISLIVAAVGSLLALRLGAKLKHVLIGATVLWLAAIIFGITQGDIHTHAFSIPWWFIGVIGSGIIFVEVLLISLVYRRG